MISKLIVIGDELFHKDKKQKANNNDIVPVIITTLDWPTNDILNDLVDLSPLTRRL